MSHDNTLRAFDYRYRARHAGHLVGENATRSGKTPNLPISALGLPQQQM